MIIQSLSLLIGLRFNRAKRRGSMVSLISVISTLSIALGIAVLIVGLSAMNGFERELNDRVLAVIPHGEVSVQNNSFTQWRKVEQQIALSPGVMSTTPYVSFTALLENGPLLRGIQIKGIDPLQEQQQSALPKFVENEGWQRFRDGTQQIILGKGIAEALKLNQGDWVSVLIPNVKGGELKLNQPKRVRLQVAGILALSGDLGYKLGLVSLTEGQKIAGIGDNVTGISITVNDIFNANYIIHNALVTIFEPLRIKTWMSDYGYMYRDIQMIRMIMYIAMVLVIAVACFNIVSTLIIAVKDKRTDIAILRTLGAKDALIRGIFIWYGFISGLLGCLAGVLLGIFFSLQLTNIIQLIESLTGQQFLAADIYFIDFLPSELYISDILLVSFTAIMLSLLASWYPAYRASKIEPAKVLSGQ